MVSMYIEQKYLLLISPQLSQFTKKGDYLYNFRCPYCGDSHKSKTKARGYVFRKEQKLLYRCHNCSKGTTLQGLLKHIDVNIYKDYIFEQFKKDKTNKELDGKLTFTQPKFMKGSPLKSLKKISQLKHDHPVKKFVDSRKIPSRTHFELFFAPKFYSWVNTIIPNKFPSTEGDHPRLVIPFFDEDNKFFCFQGRAFGNEKPKYITLKLDPDKNKIYGLNRVDKSKTKARGYVFRKEQKLLYRCHNCSKGTTLQGLLKHIDVNIYKDYIFEQFKKDKTNKELDGKLTFTPPKFMKGYSPLNLSKKYHNLNMTTL